MTHYLPAEAHRLIIERGGIGSITTLTKLADSDDPTVREDARAALERFGLG